MNEFLHLNNYLTLRIFVYFLAHLSNSRVLLLSKVTIFGEFSSTSHSRTPHWPAPRSNWLGPLLVPLLS